MTLDKIAIIKNIKATIILNWLILDRLRVLIKYEINLLFISSSVVDKLNNKGVIRAIVKNSAMEVKNININVFIKETLLSFSRSLNIFFTSL